MASRVMVFTAPNFLPVEFQRLLSDALSGATGPGAGYLPLTGGTMTGPLLLSADASADLGAVTLQQLNAAVTTLNDTIAALTARVAALEGTR
jgi:hypothetical protein